MLTQVSSSYHFSSRYCILSNIFKHVCHYISFSLRCQNQKITSFDQLLYVLILHNLFFSIRFTSFSQIYRININSKYAILKQQGKHRMTNVQTTKYIFITWWLKIARLLIAPWLSKNTYIIASAWNT